MNFDKLGRNCVGCRSCELSCPNKCIYFEEDYEGFLYPVVEEKKCVNCALCVKHCPILSDVDTEDYKQKSYAVWLNDTLLLAKSSSGGAFTGFAEHILDLNGIVFGAAFDGNLQVNQICVHDKQGLCLLKGSKYVSSNTQKTFLEVKDYLETGIKVLYSGTPCQIAGLKAFLGKEYENLYTIDLICHGVPSQKLFDKYISWLGMKYKEKIIYYGFRDKDIGGWSCGGKAKTKTKTKTINASFDPYYASFLRCETYRESCYSCKFATMQRVSDITIGDYFEGKDFYPQLTGINGVSLCIINTKKGQELFEENINKFSSIPVSKEHYVGIKGNLLKPSPRPKTREDIYSGINELPVDLFFKRFVYTKIMFRCTYYAKKIIKKVIPNFIVKKIQNFRKNNYE